MNSWEEKKITEEMTKIPQPEIEAYHAGYQAGYENGKRDAVRHGEIIKSGRRYPYCSECKCNVSDGFYRCPWCGAKFDGKNGQD